MLFLTDKLDYITQISNEIIKNFVRLSSFDAAGHCINDGTCRIDKIWEQTNFTFRRLELRLRHK